MIVKISQLLFDTFGASNIRKYPLDTLVESIKQRGFLEDEAPEVQYIGDIYGIKMYRIINGSRRVWAAQIAGLTELPVRVIQLDREIDFLMARC